ncbi:MAG: Asp23/Gls24 family envelope stress response protein [Clostridiales bacterium]|jgi:uncharacterized alkaline shock family protein YloU|nr:Asp23/Gls24 family envelope stress response protein [Clostridiales bacterium]
MSVITRNYYGNILITDEAIAQVVGNIALNSLGIADLVSKKFSDGLSDIFRRNRTSRGVRVLTNQDKIYIELFVYILYGMSIESVSQALRQKIKYGVEEFTGMSVVSIEIKVIGVKLS